ncbi:hypothetical protein LSAT2_006170 [Lamellibrachia satsuma]|nr:hypothetical protein LSAT2_006170 [Lamellibrachia satsuma]
MACAPGLYWSQKYLTCVRTAPTGCVVVPVTRTTGAPWTASWAVSTTAPCPYEAVPGNLRYYRLKTALSKVQHCLKGMIFVDKTGVCTCVQISTVAPECVDDMLLHFPFDDHFDDVTCNHAKTTKYGPGQVTLVWDDERNSTVASFDGRARLETRFLYNWFAGRNIHHFSITMWFKATGDPGSVSGLVDNGDCVTEPGFNVHLEKGTVHGSVNTRTSGNTGVGNVAVTQSKWHHVALVYNGAKLKIYQDGVLKKITTLTGSIVDTDCSLYIGFMGSDNVKGYFEGYIDDLRVYTRTLSLSEVKTLAKR